MKKAVRNISLLFAAISFTLFAGAQEHEKTKSEPKFKKTKSYSKSYNLGGGDRVSLENSFGEMKLITWDKNEIKVDVSIVGKSDEEARAQEILDRISITDGKDGSKVWFKTKMEDDKDRRKNNDDNKTRRNEGMQIDYVVYLPATSTLHASNSFGKMIVPDYRGEATIESKFGSLNAGKISNSKSVMVEFGKAEIAHINGGKLGIKFSSGSVNKLSGDIDANLEFSQVKLMVDNDVKSLDVDNSYSTVYLDLNKNFSASWSITTTHGNFDNKTAFAIKEEGKDDDNRYGPRFTHKYNGSSGSGSAKVKINSSFGKIIAGHDLKVDLNEKAKSKSKSKTVI